LYPMSCSCTDRVFGSCLARCTAPPRNPKRIKSHEDVDEAKKIVDFV
jgi:hypothetical protein